MRVYQGRLSKFTHETKFTGRINTKILANDAIHEGDDLRKLIKGKRILEEK